MGYIVSDIICERSCNDCKVRLHRNPHIGGDYTVAGMLLSFCPECGYMYPLIGIGGEVRTLSSKQKKKIGIILAKKYNLDYRVTNDLAKGIKVGDADVFVKSLADKVEKEFEVKVLIKGLRFK